MTRTYILRDYTPATPPARVIPSTPVTEVTRLRALQRRSHTFTGWLRYRYALLFASERSIRTIRATTLARYCQHTGAIR